MVSRVIQVRGGAAEAARAQSLLSHLSGVVAAEFVPGRSAVRVFCGDEMTRDMLLGCLQSRGLQGE